MRAVRVSVKAIIIEDDRLLVIHKRGQAGNDYYTLPGGGQKPGETLLEAVQRECLEELDIQVEAGELVFARDYIGKNHEYAGYDADLHILNLVFACRRLTGEPGWGSEPDRRQVGVDWLPLDGLDKYPFYPHEGIPAIQRWWREGKPGQPVYLGDIN